MTNILSFAGIESFCQCNNNISNFQTLTDQICQYQRNGNDSSFVGDMNYFSLYGMKGI